MALLFMDTFDHYYNSTLGALKWTQAAANGTFTLSSTSTSALAFPGGGQVLTHSSGGNNVVTSKTLASNYTTGIAGGWFYFTSLPGTTEAILGLSDGASLPCQVSVAGDGAGHLTVYRGHSSGSAGTLLATSASTISTNTWYHIELKATINNTTGAYEVRVNGSAVIGPTTGANTRNSANNQFNVFTLLNGASGNSLTQCKLAYVCDTSGSSAADFLGVVRGVVLQPSGAGNYAQWTANSGANFYTVKESPVVDGDLSFNATGTANNIDSFTMTDLPSGSGTVMAAQTVIYARQDAGAARTMAPFFRISSTDYTGTTVSLAASYAYYLQQYSVSPATSSAWTVSELNAAESGYKLIS